MKPINLLLCVIGLAMLTYGHLHWWFRREDPQVKISVDILFILPGWALLTMGYVGLQCHTGKNRKDEP